MKLSIFISSAIFAATTLAAPRKRGLADRVQRRACARHLSAPAKIVHEGDITVGSNVSHAVQYSNNWAGAVLTAPPSGTTFNAASGQFTVPTASSAGGQAGSASIWVGIDGDTYGNAILQAGIDVSVGADGSQSYDSWYEWWPNDATDFSTGQFSFTAGDIISISITSTDSSDGITVLTNESTGQTVSQAVSAPSGSSTLGGQNAEWIVEDYENGGSLVPFANFGTVAFSSCVAGTADGQSVGTVGATVLEMKDSNGNVLTDVSLPSSSEVQVVYHFLQHVLLSPAQASLGRSPQLAHLLNQPLSPPQSSSPTSFTEFNGALGTIRTPAAELIPSAILPNRPTLNIADLELLHNYDTSTSYTLATIPALQNFLRLNVPRIAFSQPFLLHGILAISALHLAHFKKDLRSHYLTQAHHHYQLGLRIATPLLAVMNEYTSSALYLFSTMITTFTLGMGPRAGDFLLFGEHGLAEGLVLFRGMRSLLEYHPEILEKSDLAPMFSISIRQVLRQPSNDQHLESLRHCILESTTNFADVQVYLEALEKLSRSFPPNSTSGSRPSQTSPQTAFVWLWRLSDEFLSCLQKRDPIALVILAHFCVLLNDLGSLWCMKGWADHLLSEIHKSLGEEHRMWMNWPMEEIGWIPGT
ncbi:Aspergillopepsin-2 [Hyphodiscus hymeniophilus]|uniref:Aspergillopepsin-2 n=1 Tax=Hyphodiscus hymeniophilus TaxID=353542 RepID=A0A9P6VKX4_9HELO|nr:Aspergillopepsin-2 [Hyphodiscus hymeniophilus]